MSNDSIDMIAGSVTSSIANAVVSSIGSSIVKGVFSLDATLAHLVFLVFTNLPDPQVSASWFLDSYYRLSSLSATFALVSIFIYVIRSLLSREEAIRVGKVIATLTSLPVIFVVPLVASKIFAVTNLLIHTTYGSFTSSSNVELLSQLMTSSSMNPALGAVLAFTFALATLTLTIELALRNAFIYFAITMVPFVAPFYALRGGRQVISRLISVFVTLEAFKFVVGLGLALASATSTKGNFFAVIEATALLFAVVMSPLLLVRVFFGLEGATLRQIESLPSRIVDLSNQRLVSIADSAIGVAAPTVEERSVRSKIPLHRGGGQSFGGGG